VHDRLDAAIVVGDPGRLERVLVNLLSNAMKFSDDDGVITVTATQNDKSATISIADTGIGISPEDQDRIFERFYRADQLFDPKTPGTGLGLAIVHAITTQYGGTITVDSELGRGSTFTLVLPLAGS
jgi:signal transduction histidine kinase